MDKALSQRKGMRTVTSPAMRHVERVNRELWLILSMFVIALLLNLLIDSQRMLLSFYMLPTLGSAYCYGRRHATPVSYTHLTLPTICSV